MRGRANLVEASKRDHRAALAWLDRRAPERWRLGDLRASGADDGREEDEAAVVAADPIGPVRIISIPPDKIDAFSRLLRGRDPDEATAERRLARFREDA